MMIPASNQTILAALVCGFFYAPIAAGEPVQYRILGQVSHINFVNDRQFDDVFLGTEIWVDLSFDTDSLAFNTEGDRSYWYFETTESVFGIASHQYEPIDNLGWNTFSFTNAQPGDGNDVFQTAGEIIEKGEVGNYFVQINLDASFSLHEGPLINPPLVDPNIGPMVSSQGFFTLGNEFKGVSIGWEVVDFYRLPAPGTCVVFACAIGVGSRRRGAS